MCFETSEVLCISNFFECFFVNTWAHSTQLLLKHKHTQTLAQTHSKLVLHPSADISSMYTVSNGNCCQRLLCRRKKKCWQKDWVKELKINVWGACVSKWTLKWRQVKEQAHWNMRLCDWEETGLNGEKSLVLCDPVFATVHSRVPSSTVSSPPWSV